MDADHQFRNFGRGLGSWLGWAAGGFVVCLVPLIPPVFQAGATSPVRAWVALQNLAILTLVPSVVAPLWGAESGLLLGLLHTAAAKLKPERATVVLLGHAGVCAVAWLCAVAAAILLRSRLGPLSGPLGAALGAVCLIFGQPLLGVTSRQRRVAIAVGWAIAWLAIWAIGYMAFYTQGNLLG